MAEAEEEEVVEEEEDERKMGWGRMGSAVLCQGWRLVKKVAIAGAAITSAPIVIPPLLLFTTLGLALSFPFGVYFASFACTDKVMRSLFSSPLKVAGSDEEDGDVSEGEVLRGEEAGSGEIVEVVEEEKPIEEEMREEREGNGRESVDNTALESERLPPRACLYVAEAGGEMVEEGESMKDVGREEKIAAEEDGEERDDLAVEAAEIELLFNSEDAKERDIKKVEGEKHVEEMGMEEEEGKKRELVGATILGAASIVDPFMSVEPENMTALCSDNASPVDNEGEGGVIEIVEEERTMKVQREEEEKENKEEGVGAADAEELLPSYYPFVALEPGIKHGSDDLGSGHASMIVKGNGEVIGLGEEVKGNERMGEEGKLKKRMEEQVVAATVSEGEEPLQITCASVAVVPEEHGIEIETSSLGSENATAVKGERIMESRKIVEKEQPMKDIGMGEKKKANDQGEETEDVIAATAIELKKPVERAYPVVPMANANPSSDMMEGEQPTKGAASVEKKELGDEVKKEKSLGCKEPPKSSYPFVAVVPVEHERFASAVQENENGTVTEVADLKSSEVTSEKREKNGKQEEMGLNSAIEPYLVEENGTVEGFNVLRSTEAAILAEESAMEKDGKQEVGIVVTAPESKELLKKSTSVVVAAMVCENESSLSSEYASAAEDPFTDMADVESQMATVVAGTTAAGHSRDDEGVCSEEWIWEQICALRSIVGYKADLNSSLVEELRALYLFTGVKPQLSLRRTSDLMEVVDELRFLKSVIGVK